LAEARLEDARALLLSGRYAGAYYLCGYIVECGLKACIARQIKAFEYPTTANYSRDLFTHDLPRLVVLAQLSESLEDQTRDVPGFGQNWSVVTKWTEQSRYELVAEQKARELFDAVNQDTRGVLAWIKQHW
jgi:HEPN domain-containing protein